MAGMIEIDEIRQQESRDKWQARRRYNIRELWRNSTNANKSGAVRLAEAGYGARHIESATGISHEDAIRLVTGA